ncbi:YczE/YyaS/YitT family protein [Microbacterium sp.]|uniref:membrane protein YczE n=1 Tax=Microbacterium sp. TaxID=51671 RepID=UPI003F6F2949
MPRRVIQLLVGLVLYGAGCAMTVEAGLGVDPWTVFAQGLSVRTGIGIGWITNIVGFLVLLLWIPLRQKPGVGTIANILLVGTSMQVVLTVFPPVEGLIGQLATLMGGIVLVAIASGLYIGARFGPGPRDGLMTGLHAKLGWPIWVCRASVELSVLLIGWLLGGTVGIGTVLFAVLIGPLVHIALPLLDTRRGERADGAAGGAPVSTAITGHPAAAERTPTARRSAARSAAEDAVED